MSVIVAKAYMDEASRFWLAAMDDGKVIAQRANGDPRTGPKDHARAAI
jgi:hypothetical protein